MAKCLHRTRTCRYNRYRYRYRYIRTCSDVTRQLWVFVFVWCIPSGTCVSELKGEVYKGSGDRGAWRRVRTSMLTRVSPRVSHTRAHDSPTPHMNTYSSTIFIFYSILYSYITWIRLYIVVWLLANKKLEFYFFFSFFFFFNFWWLSWITSAWESSS